MRLAGRFLTVLVLPLLAAQDSGQPGLPADSMERVQELLRERIEQAGFPPRITVGEEYLFASVSLPTFYENRFFRPAWVAEEASLSDAESLVRALREADRQGLRPRDYHLAMMESLLQRLRAGNESLAPWLLADLDLLLTDAFLVYGSHLLEGCVNPETFHLDWFAARREQDLGHALESAIESDRVQEALAELLPTPSGYGRLGGALARYRQIAKAEGWPFIPEGPALRLDDTGERVLLLRRRLIITGDLEGAPSDAPDRFDEKVQEALHRFQARQGLDSDGVVGPKTLSSLNVPAETRVRQLQLNMERWRWLPRALGKRYVLVNIPDFRLRVVEDGRTVLTMVVVVGRTYRKTPVFTDTIRYLVVNPSWGVPRSIAVRDKLPLLQEDPGYLTRMKFRIFQGWGADQREIDPSEVDWSKLSARNFPYRLRQDPGPLNALGRIKFMFPNKFNVYLHDTPTPDLFSRTERDFSSGCIRLEKPIDLAEYLMRDSPGWNRESIVAAMDAGSEKTISLPGPIAVHLLYWTAWVDEDGTVQFRRDLYGRDEKLDEALSTPPAAA